MLENTQLILSFSFAFILIVMLELEGSGVSEWEKWDRQNFHMEYISCWLNYIDWMCQQWNNENLFRTPALNNSTPSHRQINQKWNKFKFPCEKHELINIHELKFSLCFQFSSIKPSHPRSPRNQNIYLFIFLYLIPNTPYTHIIKFGDKR